MTEIELAASRAWLAMLHDLRPMPAGVALDFVQDVSGDRQDALLAILFAAVERLEGLRPERPICGSVSVARSRSVGDLLLRCDFVEARSVTDFIEGHNLAVCQWTPSERPEHRMACDWLRWCAYARRDIETCRTVFEAVEGTLTPSRSLT